MQMQRPEVGEIRKELQVLIRPHSPSNHRDRGRNHSDRHADKTNGTQTNR